MNNKNSKKKYGIFLGYPPEQTLVEQGLGRLTAFLIMGMLAQNERIVIAMPKWGRSKAEELLKDFSINPHRIEWLTTPNVPIILRIRALLQRKWSQRQLKKFPTVFQTMTGKIIGVGMTIYRAILRLFITSSLWLMPLLMLLVLLSIVAMPLIVLSIGVYTTLCWVLSYPSHRYKKFFHRHVGYLLSPLKKWKNNALAKHIYGEMRSVEFKKLIKRINERVDIDAWLVPTLFWPEIKDIHVPKVLVVPDIVYLDFPISFLHFIDKHYVQQITDSIHAADFYICFSHYVKHQQLLKKFLVPTENVQVIPHASIDCRMNLRKGVNLGLSADVAAQRIMQLYIREKFPTSHYLCTLELANCRFFLYTSQIRPHKNILNLVKAYTRLLREELVNVKLVLTGDPDAGTAHEIRHYVAINRLDKDVLFFPGVSSEVLAALNRLAFCSVNPTLFEGGFPFTFTEAYSVGTPSIMSRIPVVLEMIDDLELQKAMLFDPYNIDDMCQRMKWAVANREKLIALQAELYQRFYQRNWQQVSHEYIVALNKAIHHSNNVDSISTLSAAVASVAPLEH